jgi:hypothetical protein
MTLSGANIASAAQVLAQTDGVSAVLGAETSLTRLFNR